MYDVYLYIFFYCILDLSHPFMIMSAQYLAYSSLGHVFSRLNKLFKRVYIIFNGTIKNDLCKDVLQIYL